MGRVLRVFPENIPPEIDVSTTQPDESINPSFVHYASAESPTKPQVLRSVNANLDRKIAEYDLPTPIKNELSNLRRDHEKVVARVVLVEHQLKVATNILQARTERKEGKRSIVKDCVSVSIPELVEKLEAREKEINEKKKQAKKRGRKGKQHVREDESDEEEPVEDK